MHSETERRAALDAFVATPSGRGRPNRYWKLDLDSLDVSAFTPNAASTTVTISAPNGVTACSLEDALESFADIVARAQEHRGNGKFAHLTRAFAQTGAFVHVPAGRIIDEPIYIRTRANDAGGAFAVTIIVIEAGASATVIEEFEAVPGATLVYDSHAEVGESARLTGSAVANFPADARVFVTRSARPQRDAAVAFSHADLGAALAVAEIDITLDGPGANGELDALFFPSAKQHVDLLTRVDHRVGHTTSRTAIKSAANGSGQGRYLGIIRIIADAQGSDASLRDDALLLSRGAHIDSVPALEIAANDVKAFHGATIGAIDEEQLFYMASRGVPRDQAEKMIALGFFEPVIEKFPTERLRKQLREALEAKLA